MNAKGTGFALRAVVIAATVSFAAPALADPPIGSRIDRSGPGLTGKYDPRHSKSARPAINAYLRCSAALNMSGALKVLGAEFRSSEQLALADDFLPRVTISDDRTENCFGNFGSAALRFEPITVVGALAEYFVVERYRSKAIADIAGLTREEWQSAALTPRNASEALGMCVAEARPDLVLELVESEPESAAETTAIGEIVPLLSPCLPVGFEASFDAPALRTILAFGFYRTLSQIQEMRRAS